MNLHKELHLETEICEHLAAHGWLHAQGDAASFDRARALFPTDVLAWVQETQPAAWETLTKNHGPRAVRQVRYSLHNENSIDLVLFLNGVPVATAELKTDFTQGVTDAIDQYRFDRVPNPKGQGHRHRQARRRPRAARGLRGERPDAARGPRVAPRRAAPGARALTQEVGLPHRHARALDDGRRVHRAVVRDGLHVHAQRLEPRHEDGPLCVARG